MTYETVSDLFLFFDPVRFAGLLSSELFPEWEGVSALAALLSPKPIADERCISHNEMYSHERTNIRKVRQQGDVDHG